MQVNTTFLSQENKWSDINDIVPGKNTNLLQKCKFIYCTIYCN